METLAGKIVLTIGVNMRDESNWNGMTPMERCRIKDSLDELHKRKIDLSDEILVLNVSGYIGNSTRCEIEYAQKAGKEIRYWENL